MGAVTYPAQFPSCSQPSSSLGWGTSSSNKYSECLFCPNLEFRFQIVPLFLPLCNLFLLLSDWLIRKQFMSLNSDFSNPIWLSGSLKEFLPGHLLWGMTAFILQFLISKRYNVCGKYFVNRIGPGLPGAHRSSSRKGIFHPLVPQMKAASRAGPAGTPEPGPCFGSPTCL